MLSSLVLLAQLFALGATATRDLWLPGLPGCWQSCIGNTEDGCRSSGCICTTSAFSSSYLPSAVSCAVMQCHADEWALDVVLGSLELYCDAINWPLSDEVLRSAYAAAADQGLQSMSIAKPSSTSTTKQAAPKTTKGSSDQAVTSTYRTTLTQTTLDSNGNTIQVIVPIILGPTGYSTGSVITSTVHKATSATPSPSPAATSARSTAPSSTAPTQASSTTSSARSGQTQSPANGNGSPFQNMQAGASRRWSTSGLLGGLGAFAMLFIRL